MSMKLMVEVMGLKLGNPLRKLVLLKLADNASDQGECWPSYQTIANHCEIGRSTVRKHIKDLEKMGYLKVINRPGPKGNTSNLYQLTLHPIASDSTPIASDSTRGVASDSTRISQSFEPVNEPSRANALVTQVVEIFNTTKDEYQPNWSKCEALTKSRTTLIKNRIKDVEKRIKDTNHTVDTWFTAFLVAAANDQFYSGKPKFNGDTGYKWSIDNLLREKNFVQAIERLNDE